MDWVGGAVLGSLIGSSLADPGPLGDPFVVLGSF